MRLSAEAWLMLLIAALYLADSALLLSADEAVLLRGWRGRWRARFGAQSWRLGGKSLYLPNPFAPHQPLFRLVWDFGSEREGRPAAHPVCVPATMERLAGFVIVAALCLFVGVPIGLFTRAGPGAFIAAVIVLYANNLVALWLVHRLRPAIGLGAKPFAGLAFECLACPPCSINLLRRLCAKLQVDEALSFAVARLVEPGERADVDAHCLARLEEEIDNEAEGSARMQSLLAARQRFTSAGEPS